MSLIQRLISGHGPVGIVALGVLMVASSTAGQEKLASGVTDAIAEVNATNAQLAETMKSLNALMTTPSGQDLRPAYESYVQNVDSTPRQQGAATNK